MSDSTTLPSSSVATADSGQGGLSRSNYIAIGLGIGIGLPGTLAGIAGVYYAHHAKKRGGAESNCGTSTSRIIH